MISQVTVPMEAWLAMMSACHMSTHQGKPLHVNYMCDACGKPHTGIFLSAHPEKLMIQVLTGHEV